MILDRFGLGMLAGLMTAAAAGGQTIDLRGAIRRGGDTTAIAGVDVRLPELHLAATSDARGEFRFSRVPAGRWLFELRRIGFTQLDTIVQVSEHADAV